MFLYLKAELDGVTELAALDNEEEPFEWSFKVQCTKCRETNDKTVTINRFEQHEMPGSRGKANFVYKCGFCGGHGSINIATPKGTSSYTVENSGSSVAILDIDSRGVEPTEFVPDGYFRCHGTESTTVFEEVDLSEGEWYDYDELSSNEVSITEVEWKVGL